MSEASAAADANPEFLISRIFKAPRQRVWDAWTMPEVFTQWFGPKGTNATVLHLDLRPGGMLHSIMETPGGPMWGKFVYREVDEPSRLVWEHSFSDANANIVRAPFAATWPLVLLTTVVFADCPEGTRITLTWSPVDATAEERRTFRAAMSSMTGGWSGSFEALDRVLDQPA